MPPMLLAKPRAGMRPRAPARPPETAPTVYRDPQAYTLEVERLTDDNALLANRLEQMELDLK